jgi:hypothetical protein
MEPTALKFGTKQVMDHIQEVIRDTSTPSWVESVPRNFGDPAAGSLKADEWRTMATIYLPIALISIWGEGTTHATPELASTLRQVLDHTMDLVRAIYLAGTRTTTEARTSAYHHYIKSWLSKQRILHPTSNHRANAHMAVHVADFLRLFGPVRSWWCFPFERLIGQLQRLPSNSKFGEYSPVSLYRYANSFPTSQGQLEATMLSTFTRSAKLKQWIARPDSPPFLKECKRYLDKAFSTTSEDSNHVADSAFRAIPAELRGVIPAGSRVATRARHLHDGVVFSRSKTHVGNSLIMYYPNGNRRDSPIPAEIENIVVGMDQKYTYVVRRQLPAPPGTVDPFAPYLHFPAKVFSSKVSSTLEVVSPHWVMTHYARWNLDRDRVVVLDLSRVRMLLRYSIDTLLSFL